MTILILGVGAIGGTIAASLVRAGHNVWATDAWFQHVIAIRTNGLSLVTPEERITARVETVTLDELDAIPSPIDLLIVAVKSYDTSWMARLVAPYLADSCVVVSAQDGMNEEMLGRLLGPERVLGCAVTFSAELVGPGQVVKASREDWPCFVIGELEARTEDRMSRIADLLGCVGPVRTSDNIIGELWSKLTIICATNACAGVTLYTLSELWAEPVGIALSIHLAGEVVAVAEAIGHRMEPILSRIPPQLLREAHQGDSAAWTDATSVMREFAQGGARGRGNKPSLLQDILRGRRTEIDCFNGYAAARGAEMSLPTSANSAIIQIVKEIELGNLQPGPDNLGRLASLLPSG